MSYATQIAAIKAALETAKASIEAQITDAIGWAEFSSTKLAEILVLGNAYVDIIEQIEELLN